MLHEDPAFLQLLDEPRALAYVAALLNPRSHLHRYNFPQVPSRHALGLGPTLALKRGALAPQRTSRSECVGRGPRSGSTDGYLESASEATLDQFASYGSGWHIDGIGNGFRELFPGGTEGTAGHGVPLLQVRRGSISPAEEF